MKVKLVVMKDRLGPDSGYDFEVDLPNTVDVILDHTAAILKTFRQQLEKPDSGVDPVGKPRR